MGLFLANPWGLLGLLALPAIVGIHCLQQRSRRVRTSTLFLLEHSQPVNEGGLRFERFHNSLPFWMQLVAAAAISWLLADPRWIRADSRQTVAVVLDSSASMRAFRDRTLASLATRLRAWQATAARTDWHLLETGPRRPPLYAGDSLLRLLEAADRWNPTLGAHAFDDALAVAASLVPAGGGGVILVTDRPCDAPEGVAVLSVGEPFDNVGFSGGSVASRDGRRIWRVLVTNHGDSPQTREMSLAEPRKDGQDRPAAAATPVTLEPGQSREFTGDWPDAERLMLRLSADRFDRDDTLPLVRPVPRQVRVAVLLSGSTGDLLARMVAACSDVERVPTAADADLVIEPLGGSSGTSGVQAPVDAVAAGPDEPQAADDSAAGQSADPPAKAVSFDPAWISAEDHPLTRDLGWGGLLSPAAGNLRVATADEPLLWKGGRPLAFVRNSRGQGGRRIESLVLNWDVAASTAARTPAMVVLLQRFVDRVRTGITRPWAENVETGQRIDLPDRPARAPDDPGFFTLPAEQPLLTGAAQFADSRECDFRSAGPFDSLDAIRRGELLKRSVRDPWAPLWIAVATAAMLVAWIAAARPPSAQARVSVG